MAPAASAMAPRRVIRLPDTMKNCSAASLPAVPGGSLGESSLYGCFDARLAVHQCGHCGDCLGWIVVLPDLAAENDP